MGACSSIDVPQNGGIADLEATANSSALEDDLQRDHAQSAGIFRFLLLGAGESGKSTIFKQMRILYGTPRSDDDLRMYGVVVRSNIIVAMRQLCVHLRFLGLEESLEIESMEYTNTVAFADRDDPSGISSKEAYETLIAHLVDMTAPPIPADQNYQDWVGHSGRAGLAASKDAKLFLHLVEPIRVLWQSRTMRKVWTKRAAVNVIDSHKEYLQDLSRIASPAFRPSTQDILRTRVRTTQVIMERYHIEGTDFEMYDVGGQRSERRKWIDCFDNVDAVIFVAALSEYDQHLVEAKRQNRMVEALELFRSICNNRAFTDSSILLFLNKKDIFAEKIMYSDIASQSPFKDFAGPPQDFDHGVYYFMQRFKDCVIGGEFNEAYTHVTIATDTNNMEFVMTSTRMILMSDNLRKSGIL